MVRAATVITAEQARNPEPRFSSSTGEYCVLAFMIVHEMFMPMWLKAGKIRNSPNSQYDCTESGLCKIYSKI